MKLLVINNYTFQVSDDDFETLSLVKWRISNERGYIYATHSMLGKMHRFILGVRDSKILVDHKDRNTLNCQRDNLRISTHQQNCCNSKVRFDSTTGYKGVTYNKNTGRYDAKITYNGRSYTLRSYITPYQAMLAYNKKAIELHGEFAGLNTPTFEDQFKCYLRGETNVMPNKIKEV